jgi:serine/threonine-protein kinase RsbW
VRIVVGESLTLQVRNFRDAIAPAGEAAEVWLQRCRPSSETLYFVLLAIEELVTNCIKYGYDDSNVHTIFINLLVDNQALTMIVTDDGHPFDPLGVPPPDFSVPIQERPIGGLGIYLLRELADHIMYERCDDKNRLTLTKRMG